MAKSEPMPHYERLLNAASNHAGRYFLGHCVVDTTGGLRILPMWSSKDTSIEPRLLQFMRQLFGPCTKEEPKRRKK